MSERTIGQETPYGVVPRGERLPAATRLGPVRLQVAELARSLAYYREVLELRLLEWEIVLPRGEDAEEAARRLEAAGYPAARAEGDWLVDDPWGTTLRLRGATS